MKHKNFIKNTIFIIPILFFALAGCAFCEELTHTYSQDNKFGLIKNNEKITEAKYSKLIRLKDKSWLFLYKNKYGIISNSGEILIEPKYTQAQRIAGRFVKFAKGGKYCLYDENANLIVPLEYSSINLLYGKMFLVCKNYKYGLISFDGDIILAPVMDDIYMPKSNTIKLSYEGNWYEITQEDKTTFEFPKDLMDIQNDENTITMTQIVQNPLATTGYGLVSSGDYFIKLFSSLSPAYEKTIDQLVLNNGADAVSILMKCSWLVKFPYFYAVNYVNNVKAPNNGPLSEVKINIKNKIK